MILWFLFFLFKDNLIFFFFFSSRRRHTRYWRDWSSDVCSSDLPAVPAGRARRVRARRGCLSEHPPGQPRRSEERRVGKECRSRGSPYHYKKKRKVEAARMQQTSERRQTGLDCIAFPAHDLLPRQADALRQLRLRYFFFSSRRRHPRYWRDWSSDVCSSDLSSARWSGDPVTRESPSARYATTAFHQSSMRGAVDAATAAGKSAVTTKSGALLI